MWSIIDNSIPEYDYIEWKTNADQETEKVLEKKSK